MPRSLQERRRLFRDAFARMKRVNEFYSQMRELGIGMDEYHEFLNEINEADKLAVAKESEKKPAPTAKKPAGRPRRERHVKPK